MNRTAIPPLLLRLVYGVYAWIVLICCLVPVSIACLLVPGTDRRRAVARWGAATVLALIGSPVRVVGSPGKGRYSLVVANHSSYLDGIILTAVLPPEFTFLIKREMIAVPLAGFLLKRLGSEFVDRANHGERHRSARRLLDAALSGYPLAVFPEGTFDPSPGLKPFRMGAFRAAWRAGLTVVPTVITGARQKLPSRSWLPRPGPIAVQFCAPLEPGDFDDETGLMRATRKAIVERLAEPDLEEIAPRSAPHPPRPGSAIHHSDE